MTSNITLFALRNVKVFFRDRAAVVYSMFAAIIIIALYFLFLGDSIADSIPDMPNARIIADSWAMAGLLAVVPVTSTLGALGLMIQDKISGSIRDLSVSPLRTHEIVGGYVFSTFIIGIVMSSVALVFAEAYILSSGGSLLNATEFAKVLGIMLLSVVSGSAVMFVIALFVNSNNAFSAVNTIIGVMIGFLIGAYIPIGYLPSGMAAVAKIVPATHSASLFRQVMMERPMENMASMPPEDILQFKLDMGVRLEWGDGLVSPTMSILVLAAVGVAFFVFATLKLSIKRKE